MSSESEWRNLSLIAAGVTLIDCDHKTPEAVEDGYPYIAIPQLKDGHIKLEGVRRISQSDYENWTKKLAPQADDVIVVRRCNSGQSAYVPVGLKCAIGQNLVVLRADGTKVLPKYLRWLVRGSEWWSEVGKYINVGAIFDSLRCRDIPNFELPIPPLTEQREISSLLAALDDRVSLLRETNATLEAIAQALFKSWFVDFDPVRAKMEGRVPEGMEEATAALFPDRLVESELGAVPERWRASKLHIATSAIFSGGTPDTRRPDFWGGEIPWFSSGETRNLVVVDTEKRITKAGVDESSTRLVHPGDILIASAGQGHTRGQTSYCGLDCYINQSVVALRAGELCKPSWLFCNLARRYDEMRNLSDSHSSRGSLTTKLLSQMPLVLPPLDIIEAFDKVASPLLTSIISNVKQSQALAALRDTLLPRLISGQLRLPDVENQIEAVAA